MKLQILHNALTMKQFLANRGILVLEHPQCSPDSTPSDFLLLPDVEVVKTKRGIMEGT